MQCDIFEIEAYWQLGLLPLEELPAVAANLLSNGFRSDVLVELSALDSGQSEEVERLFRQMLTESGHGTMSQIEALRIYARSISISILSGEMAPYEGALSIWRATLVVNKPDFHELDTFIYAASEMDDRFAEKQMFEDAIFEEATRWAGYKLNGR